MSDINVLVKQNEITVISDRNVSLAGEKGDQGEQGIPGGNITNASELPFTPTGSLSSTNVQNALAELDSEKAGKLFATNIVTNGDFSQGTAGFLAEQATLAIVNGEGEITSNTVGGTAYGLTVQNLTLFSNRKYYISYKIKPFRTHIPLFWVGVAIETDKTVTTGVMTNVSSIFQPPANRNNVTIYGNRGLTTDLIVGSKVSFDNIIIIDITSIFGLGKEPTAQQMDWLLAQKFTNSWFNGTAELTSITDLLTLVNTKADKTQEAWITPTLLNGFTQQGTYTVGYRKDSMGRVLLRGGLANSTTGAAFTLPIGYRPTTERLFVGYTATTSYGKIAIATNGNVLINSIVTYIFLDEVIFDTV